MPARIMKTPISYYGGKQRLVPEILPLIPQEVFTAGHQYVEPFCGGAAVFWAKRPSENEVINDYDLRVANFFEAVKYEFDSLQWLVQNTLHSEYEYQKAARILKAGLNGNRVEYAWAFWVQTNMSFGKKLFGGFAFGNDGSRPAVSAAKRSAFTAALSERLARVEIFNRDALELIRAKDGPQTFFYLDPPYPESDAGHYDNGKEVYYSLLELLPALKGKWLLSSYPSATLDAFRQAGGYAFMEIEKNLSVSGKHNAGKRKTECLAWNYDASRGQMKLF